MKLGREDMEDNPCNGQPPTTTTEDVITKVHDMMLQDHHIKVHENKWDYKHSTKWVYHVLKQELDILKISARWVSYVLTLEQKCT